MGITLTNINKTFGTFKALDNINIEFVEGELTALLGPSGSGKTSLLRLIAGLEIPDPNSDSRITFDGSDVSHTKVGERQVGFVFQHYALFRHLTVFENIAFGLRVKPKKERPSRQEIQDTVHELLGLIQLEPQAHRLPSQLSGGQRQRVALARALAIKPRVLLLDEPFGALDAKVRAELRAWLRGLHEKLHFTSVFVTHDQEEALEVSDKIVVLNNGRIEQVGTPDEVFHHPQNEFVMRFLGDVNVFHSRNTSIPFKENPDQENENHSFLIRPHDFQVFDKLPPHHNTFPATITKIQTAGSVVKIECFDSSKKAILVHISHDEFKKLSLHKDQQFFLSPRQSKIYSHTDDRFEDYSI
jgi:sulfate/thiosulfate transport system ATP-binding protein